MVSSVEATLLEIIPDNSALVDHGVALAAALKDTTDSAAILEVLALMHSFYKQVHALVASSATPPFFAPSESEQKVNISTVTVGASGHLVVSWPITFGSNLVEAVRSNVCFLRDSKRNPTFAEFVVEHIAYLLIAHGKYLSSISFREGAKFLGTVGFRSVSQTYPSLTDPGDGHVFGTSRKNEWLQGAIVHVEHLERPGGVPRTSIESYRIPAILDFAKTRLHTSGAMPNTYFTGRALRDSSGNFQQSFIKVVNTTSAACSQAFSLGAAECKIAMDDLSTSQMVAYLKALSGHVIRDVHQYLSCAFNLNWPIVQDDVIDADGNLLEPRLITDPFEIAQLGISIACRGGFDKVTWDGASDTYPSKCIIHQLPFEQWLFLAHRAHECGLTTYTSAGFKFPQICYGVWAGIDGLGIGGAQILRHMDHETGRHGPYTEENLDRILDARNDAANHIRGRGVALLARLDRMFFEGSITGSENELRSTLFDALARVDESTIETILADPALHPIVALPDDGERPYACWAQRLLRDTPADDPVLLRNIAQGREWDSLAIHLSFALREYAAVDAAASARTAPLDVELDVYDVHVSKIWTDLRQRKAATTNAIGQALSRHDNVVRLKTTPFSSNAESRRSSGRSSAAPSALSSPVASRRPSKMVTLTDSP